MKKSLFIFVALFVSLFASFTAAQEKIFGTLYNEVPEIKSVYFGFTQMGIYTPDNKQWTNESVTRVAAQFEFVTPLTTVVSKMMSDFRGGSATHFYLRNDFGGLRIEAGYHPGPITFLHRGDPFNSGGQFEYGAMVAIAQGSNPGVRVSSHGVFASTHAVNYDGKLVATYGGGLQQGLAGVDFKLAGYYNQHLSGAAITVDALGSTAMIHWRSDKTWSGFIDACPSKWVGRLYVDYVNANKKTSHLEFGQYYTPNLFKDLSAAIGWGYRTDPVKFFYVYTFVHI